MASGDFLDAVLFFNFIAKAQNRLINKLKSRKSSVITLRLLIVMSLILLRLCDKTKSLISRYSISKNLKSQKQN